MTEQQTNIENLSINFKLLITIISLAISIATTYFTVDKKVEILTLRIQQLEDYKQNNIKNSEQLIKLTAQVEELLKKVDSLNSKLELKN